MTMPTFVTGAVVHQWQLNRVGNGIINMSTLATGAAPPRAYIPAGTVNITSTHSLPNNTDTTTTWDAQGVNNDTMWVTGAGQLTIRSNGVYIALAQVHISAAPGGTRACHVMLNGTSIIANSVAVTAVNALNAGAGNAFTALSGPLRLGPGATLYLSTFQNQGSTLTINNQESGTFLAAIRIGA